MVEPQNSNETLPTLSISPEKICFIVVKAREFDAKDVVTDPDDGSNASDDAMISVLEDHPDDPVLQELQGFIGALSEDEQIDLVAHEATGPAAPANGTDLLASMSGGTTRFFDPGYARDFITMSTR